MSDIGEVNHRVTHWLTVQLAALGSELRDNPRTKLGLVLLAFVAVLGGALKVYTNASDRRVEVDSLVSEQQRLQVLSQRGAATWLAASAKADGILAESAAQLWSKGDVGVAHADFLDWISHAASFSGLNGASVRISEVRRTSKQSNVLEMRVAVSASAAAGAQLSMDGVYKFLRVLSECPRRIVARSIRVRFAPVLVLDAEFAAFAEPRGVPKDQSGPLKGGGT